MSTPAHRDRRTGADVGPSQDKGRRPGEPSSSGRSRPGAHRAGGGGHRRPPAPGTGGDPGQSPYSDPGQSPYADPRQSPYSDARQSPYADPGQSPYADPRQSPYADPGQSPYADPRQSPYADPGQSPYSDLRRSPYADPGQSPYSDPRQSPYADPRQSPYADPRQSPYRDSGQSPYSAASSRQPARGGSAWQSGQPRRPSYPPADDAQPAMPAGQAPETPLPPTRDAAENVDVVRSSGVMALGTLASRATGFLRTLVLVYVVAEGAVANSYNNANTLPNAVYDLMLGGILTSVVVPLLVNATKRDTDGGEGYYQRMFTLGAVSLFAVTFVATLAASLLVGLYAHSFTGGQFHLTVIFAYFFIPQIFFYGMTSLAGAILNARGKFAAPMWTPVINNIVVIFVLLLFAAAGGSGRSPGTISSGQVQLLGFGTTLGIIAQTVALIPSLRRVGFRWHPRFDFRRAEVTEILRMAGPLFGYIATTQVSFLVVQNVANKASQTVSVDGFSTYGYAWQLFQMPYAIVGISVITALLPRMSAHASERRYSLVRSDFSHGVRLSSVIVVPAALVLAVLGGPFAQALMAYGRTSAANASYIGTVFAIFSLGLVPYMLFQLLLRVFYALHDSRTPMFIGVAVMVTNIVASLLALAISPAGHVVEGLAVAFGLGNLVGAVVCWRIVSRRIGGLDGRAIASSLIRMHAAAIPSMVFAMATIFMIGVVLSAGPVSGIITMIFAGGGGLFLYLLFSRALGVSEVTDLTASLRTRLGR